MSQPYTNFVEQIKNSHHMKKYKIIVSVMSAMLLTACSENVEKSAQRFLNAAEEALAAGSFSEAKAQIDSIKVVYPKAFEARKAGIALMRKVEIAEAEQTYAYTDNLLNVEMEKAKQLIPHFLFEKNAEYQEIGNYLAPSQRIEDNLERNYLRATVDEKGHMVLASLWRGPAYIHHRRVKVSGGGTFAETPESKNPYESSDALAKTERNDYALGEDGGVIAFIALHRGETLKVEYIGDKTSVTTLTAADTRAIADVYELAQVLTAIEGLNAMQDETTRKIAFHQSKEEQESLPVAKGAEEQAGE